MRLFLKILTCVTHNAKIGKPWGRPLVNSCRFRLAAGSSCCKASFAAADAIRSRSSLDFILKNAKSVCTFTQKQKLVLIGQMHHCVRYVYYEISYKDFIDIRLFEENTIILLG